MWISFVLCPFFIIGHFVNGKPQTYRNAFDCADEVLKANPDLPSQWIYPNGTFGGKASSFYTGWINESNSSMPSINIMNGPQGLRDILIGTQLKDRRIWPAAATYGMTWSPELTFHAGMFMASDFDDVHANVVLAPSVNVHRLPTGGRNWESISGEDAHLGVLAHAFVHGLQSNGLMGTLKNLVLNNQELGKDKVISSIDEETLYMEYLRAFKPALDAGVGAVMCSPNQIKFNDYWDKSNSHAHACGSERLRYILRHMMHFEGAVMTDLDAKMTNDTIRSISTYRNFANWEMSSGDDLHVPIPEELHYRGHVHHVLTGMFASGILSVSSDLEVCENAKFETKFPRQDLLPRMYADMFNYSQVFNSSDIDVFGAVLVAEGMVLLKNRPGTLPLRRLHPIPPPHLHIFPKKYVLLAGSILLSGGGSGDSSKKGHRNGGKKFLEKMASIIHKITHYQVEWDFQRKNTSNHTYDYILAFGAQFRTEGEDGYYNIDQCNSSESYKSYGNCSYSEFIKGFDKKIQHNHTKIISITTTGGVHYPDYMDLVDAAITLMYPGQFLPLALALVLKGDISPGGKLTFTLPTLETQKPHVNHIQSPIGRFNPGLDTKRPPPPSDKNSTKKPPPPPPHFKKGFQQIEDGAHWWDDENGNHSNIVQYGHRESNYVEKLLIGYKYFEKYEMIPAFPFGFGLTYRKLKVVPNLNSCISHAYCHLEFKVTDPRSGDPHYYPHHGHEYPYIASEVIQIYVGYITAIPNSYFPVKELRRFMKVWGPGVYKMELKEDNFKTTWDARYQRWLWPCHAPPFMPGWFRVSVGTSSDHILRWIELSC